jgi:ABC-type taurine transport system ATPase subunit
MRRELVRLLEQRPRTVLFVTHDIEEAAQLADRILVLSDRPASIRRELGLELPQPRALTHPVVVHAVEQILAELGLEEEAGEEMEQAGVLAYSAAPARELPGRKRPVCPVERAVNGPSQS